MLLRTVVRDCLYVNWALPREHLPALPEGLRYELHAARGGRYGFVSALLFHQSGLRLSAAPWIRVSHPQLNIRLYVVDAEGVPSVLFRALVVPRWVLPLAKLTGQKGLAPGRLDYARPSRDTSVECWRWQATSRGRLEVSGAQGVPALESGPELGPWQRTCDYFRRRDRGYVTVGGRLRRLETSHSSVAIWPMNLEIGDVSLVRRSLGIALDVPWPELHSGWLCPEIPLTFALGPVMEGPLPTRVPAPG